MNMKQMLILACVTSMSLGAFAGSRIDLPGADLDNAIDEQEDFLATMKDKSFEIGLEIYSYKYEEPGLMEQDGIFSGISASYTKRRWLESESVKKWMLRLEGQFAWGQVDYDGGLQDGTPITTNNIDNYTYDLRVLIGADFLRENSLTTIYAGLGYRHLFHDGSPHQYNYDRKSYYLYLPVGIKGLNSLTKGWSWGWCGEFDLLLLGRQESDLTQYGYGEITNDQESGYGLRASVKFQKHAQNTDFIIEPFIRYWDIEDSDVSRGWMEPANETLEYGIRFTWLF